MSKRCVLILLDGLGDRAYEQFGQKTPLAAARTPCLDSLAKQGASGLYHATRFGAALPSEIAHYAMFGYDINAFPGRGALEALGAGVALRPEDVALLAHFASAREEAGRLRLLEDVPRITPEEAEELFDAVASFKSEGVSLNLHRTRGAFGVLILEGAVSPWVTDTGTMREGSLLSSPRPYSEMAEDESSQRTARALQAYLTAAYQKLSHMPVNLRRVRQGQQPINILVTQRAGRVGSVPSFQEMNGLRGLLLADGCMYEGLARYIGLDFEGTSPQGGPAEEMARLLVQAGARLKSHDFIHVHTKAPDQAAHTKKPEHKKEVIERLDQGIGQEIGSLLEDPDVLVVVTADHSTPSSGPLIHSGEPVPVLFLGQGVRRDDVSRFDEVSVASGSLGCLRGDELLLMILNHMDRSRLGGIRESSFWSRSWPGSYEPFLLGGGRDEES